METGDLQPLQNLNQLTELSLEYCSQLTGQSVSEICGGTTSSRFDRPILGTLAPLAGLSQLQTLNLSGDDDVPMNFEGRILKLCGHNQRCISFALRFCIGTLEPISGLLLLQELNLNDSWRLTGTLLVYGHNQLAI